MTSRPRSRAKRNGMRNEARGTLLWETNNDITEIPDWSATPSQGRTQGSRAAEVAREPEQEVNNMPALTNHKHEQFVALVAISSESGEDVVKAYTTAGYKANSFHVARSAGFRLLKTVEIRQRLVELRNIPAAGARAEEKFVEVMSDIAAERKWVLASLKAVAKRCMQAEPMLDSKGRPTGEYTFQASGANRALELLGKEYGMFVDRSDTTHRYATLSEFIDNAAPEEIQAELTRLEARKEAKAGSKVVN